MNLSIVLDGPRETMPDRIVADWRATALGAVGKQVRELNDKEKFCIAFCSGVEIESYTLERRYGEPEPVPTMNWRTKKPCGIVNDREGFRVYVSS